MTDELVALATVEAAERTARTLITGIRECAETGHPLNELQQIALVKLALLEYDGLETSLRGSEALVDVLKVQAAASRPTCPACDSRHSVVISRDPLVKGDWVCRQCQLHFTPDDHRSEARDRLDWDAPL